MQMKMESLSQKNVDIYIDYLKKAMLCEPDMMTAEHVDETAIRNRMNDAFYRNTKSILALVDEQVAGRIEYHFYGCMQDGCRMSYVDWVYVLPEYRHQGIAKNLFKEFEKDCKDNGIDQYYLIRARNKNADAFYRNFENASLQDEPLLRKELK